MSISRIIRDRAPLNVQWRNKERCEVCGFDWFLYSSTRYGEDTDHCFRCHSHRRKRRLAWAVKQAMFSTGACGSVLEIAPGGQLSEMLRNRYRGYIGLRYPPYSAEALPLASNSIDVVISCDVIEHFERPAVAMREVNRVLVPGGVHLSAVLVERGSTYYAGGRVIGHHMDEDGGKCPVYTALGRDLARVAAEWIGCEAALLSGVLRVAKAREGER